MEDLIRRLKNYQSEKGLTQEELAREIETTLTNISRWANGGVMSKSSKKIVRDFFKKVNP